MKKFISFILIMCLCLPLAFSVDASEMKPVYELDLFNHPLGSLTPDHSYNPTDKATLKVVESDDETDRWIEVRDNDISTTMGFQYVLNHDIAKQTLSFDYRLKSSSATYASFYCGSAMFVTGQNTPQYYTGTEYIPTKGRIAPDEWINIVFVLDSTSNTFDMYTDGILAVKDAPTRDGNSFKAQPKFTINTNMTIATEYDIKNFKVYDGEYVPELPEKMLELITTPDRVLVDYSDANDRLNKALGNAVAMTVGNSMARVNNSYVNIDPDNKYVAPFITEDGYTLIPTRFTTETIGCNVEVLSSTSFRFSKDGTVMEINMGDKNAIINGQSVEMPTTPVIKYDRLFIPLRFAAETYGKKVFWDDRGLIIISDGDVVKAGQEDIIKPLINEIRSRTAIFGNKKYSDVNYSTRYFRVGDNEWGSLDAAKRFMATVNRWTYVIGGDDAKALRDQGVLQQGTINACATDEYLVSGSEKDAKAYFLSGAEYTRADGMRTWGCINKPSYWENLKERLRTGIDSGYFVWQFDDYPVNYNYRLGGCMCKYCVEGLKNYIKNDASEEELQLLATQGITNYDNFDIVKWLAEQGIKNETEYGSMIDKPIDVVRKNFLKKRRNELHSDIIKYIKEYSGSDVFYSINSGNTLNSYSTASVDATSIFNIVNSVMGETAGNFTTAESIYAVMQLVNSTGLENVISPLPKDLSAKQNMYSGIPMCYATGQQMLVPWDDWLFGSTRYYATLEELGGSYEFAREYPFLLDNYEIPTAVGYVIDLDVDWKKNNQLLTHMLYNGTAAKGIVVGDEKEVPYDFKDSFVKGLQAIIGPENMEGLSEAQKAKITNSGAVYVPDTDTATVQYLENTYWTVRNNNDKVYTVLRQNQLYDNAPTVVHAVSYNEGKILNNVELEINNLYLPAGDSLKINVYQPGENCKTITVPKGNGSTKVTLDSINRWTVLEICGPSTVRREVAFDLGEGYNGIGMGSRISKDKAFGNVNNFTIVTYSEGINSTTFGDSGTQDEAAFVYRRMDKSKIKKAFVTAGFTETNGEFGVMVRDGIYSNARFAALMYDNKNGLRLAVRKHTDKTVLFTNLGNVKPAYMKLQRDGSEYIAYVSDDNSNFTEVARVEIGFDAPVGGVFAASPNGSRSECKVNSLLVSDGNFPSENIDVFKIKCDDGKITVVEKDKKIEATLETKSYKNIGIDDVVMNFSSSDESVLTVAEDGTVIPKGIGTATVTAVAKMGLKQATATTKITVEAGDPVMFEESFEKDVWPEYMKAPASAMARVKNGVLQGITENSGVECDMSFTFEQLNMPAVFEFDFKAHYGVDSKTTGARVIYANNQAISLTSDPGTLNWFYGDKQTKIADLTTDEWHHIKIEANYDEQWCNVYLDGVKVVDKGEPRTPMTPNGAVVVGAWRIGTDSCYEWDNFKFYYVASFE